MLWFVENLYRYKREREALDTLASRVDWLVPVGWRIDDSLHLIWDANIFVAGELFPISVRYPSHFPHSPVLLLPRGETGRWSSHQYGPGGELCLEYGPDNWHPDLTGADMVLSAHRLLQGERSSPAEEAVVTSRHKTTLGQDLRGSLTRLLVTREVQEMSSQIPEGVILLAKTLVVFSEKGYVRLVSSVAIAADENWRAVSLPTPLFKLVYEEEIALFRWPLDMELPPAGNLATFSAAIEARGLVLPSVPYVVVVRGQDTHAYALLSSESIAFESTVIVEPEPTRRVDETYAGLNVRKVALVGCGSLGSKLAVMLARSGVHQFLLIDDDILLPENLVRHDLDWMDVGTHKVDSLATRIQLVNPSATCEKRRHRLGGQESSGALETLIEGLANTDLIIDATAEPTVFNYLSAVTAFAKRPLLWAEVFGGGFGGLIARHRPLLEPDPASMRRAIESWCADLGQPIERALGDYGGGPEIPRVADDADVGVIAAHAARMAIDLLIQRVPSAFPYSVYIIGLAKGWIFEQPFETYPIDVGPPLAVVSEPPLEEAERQSELIKIIRLLEHRNDAGSSQPPDIEATPA